MTTYFTAATFGFLRELAANNNRVWWEANKSRYLSHVREPALDFIADFAGPLATISPRFRADTRTNGGSLMRPYRDARFARNETPYKTNVGIQFRHENGADVHAPGFYLHLEPSRSFAGAGMWSPTPAVAATIRHAIDADPAGWSDAAHDRAFVGNWSLGEDDVVRLKRIPKGFDPDHPHPDDLRLRSFVARTTLTQKEIVTPGFADDLLESFKETAPFTRFLCTAIGVAF